MTSKKQILYLEADAREAELVRSKVAADGLAVEWLIVRSPSEYQQALQEQQPDLVLAGAAAPALESSSALSLARQSHPDIPFIVVSGEPGEAQVLEILRYGATDHVSKSQLDCLGATIRRALHEAEERQARQEAQAALREATLLLERTFASLDQAVLVVDPRTRTIIMANQAVERVFGHRVAEVIGQSTRILHVDQARFDEFGRQLFPALDRHGVFRTEFQMRRKNGEDFYSDITVTEIRDASGQRSGVVSVVSDITQRRQAEAALRRSKQELDDFFENAAVALHWVGPDGTILRANRAELELLGYSREEYVGHHIAEFHADQDVIDDILQRLGRQETLIDYEARVRCKDGSIKYVQISSNVHWDGDQFRHTRCFTQDISARRQAELLRASWARQKASLVELSQRALAEHDLSRLMDEITVRVAETLDVEMCKVLELTPDGRELRLMAGVGWKPGLVGQATVSAGKESQAGFTLLSNKPVIVADLRTETRFNGPALLHNHGVISGISTIIRGETRAYGVLGAHTAQPREFTSDDTNYLQSVANVLATAIDRARLYEAERQASAYATFLAEVSKALSASLEAEVVLQTVTRLVLPTLADYSSIHMAGGETPARLAAATHVDPSQELLLRELYAGAADPGSPAGLVDQVTRSGQPAILAEITPEQLERFAPPGSRRRLLLDSLQPQSMVILPLEVRDQVLGAISFTFSTSGRRYGPAELRLAEEVARRAAQAVDTARLFAETQRAKTDLEQRVNIRTAELQEANERLAREVADRTQAEHQFRELLESAPDAMVMVDSTGRILLINSQTEAVFGYPREVLVGQSVEVLLPARYREHHVLHRKDFAAEPRKRSMGTGLDLFGLRPDGSEFPVEISLSPLQRPEGLVVLASIRDISERRRIEEDLRLHSTILSQMAEGVVLVRTSDASIAYTNRKFETMFGYDPGELIGRPVHVVNAHGAQDPEETARAIIGALRRDGFWSGEVYNVRKDGTPFWCWATVSTLEHSAFGQCWVAIHIEVTDRKRAQAELEESRQQLRSLYARLQEIRESERAHIAREIHDELGGALTGLKMDLRRLRQRLDTAGSEPLALVDTLSASIDQLVFAVRHMATELRPAVLDDFGLLAAIEWQLGEFERRSSIRCQLVSPAIDIDLDIDSATAVFRVFQETLTNIARHAQATEVKVTFEDRGDHLSLQVSDNGRGMDLNSLAQGKSLGLVGMRERVGPLGGDVAIQSAPGQGTTIVVKIPWQGNRPRPAGAEVREAAR